jgi:hypothetical protein
MGDLKDPRLIWLKAWIFVGIGVLSALLLLLRAPQWPVAIYLALAVWAFCRAYYFIFYVIQHYVDPSYKFAGLGSFVAYLFRERARKR